MIFDQQEKPKELPTQQDVSSAIPPVVREQVPEDLYDLTTRDDLAAGKDYDFKSLAYYRQELQREGVPNANKALYDDISGQVSPRIPSGRHEGLLLGAEGSTDIKARKYFDNSLLEQQQAGYQILRHEASGRLFAFPADKSKERLNRGGWHTLSKESLQLDSNGGLKEPETLIHIARQAWEGLGNREPGKHMAAITAASYTYDSLLSYYEYQLTNKKISQSTKAQLVERIKQLSFEKEQFLDVLAQYPRMSGPQGKLLQVFLDPNIDQNEASEAKAKVDDLRLTPKVEDLVKYGLVSGKRNPSTGILEGFAYNDELRAKAFAAFSVNGLSWSIEKGIGENGEIRETTKGERAERIKLLVTSARIGEGASFLSADDKQISSNLMVLSLADQIYTSKGLSRGVTGAGPSFDLGAANVALNELGLSTNSFERQAMMALLLMRYDWETGSSTERGQSVFNLLDTSPTSATIASGLSSLEGRLVTDASIYRSFSARMSYMSQQISSSLSSLTLAEREVDIKGGEEIRVSTTKNFLGPVYKSPPIQPIPLNTLGSDTLFASAQEAVGDFVNRFTIQNGAVGMSEAKGGIKGIRGITAVLAPLFLSEFGVEIDYIGNPTILVQSNRHEANRIAQVGTGEHGDIELMNLVIGVLRSFPEEAKLATELNEGLLDLDMFMHLVGINDAFSESKQATTTEGLSPPRYFSLSTEDPSAPYITNFLPRGQISGKFPPSITFLPTAQEATAKGELNHYSITSRENARVLDRFFNESVVEMPLGNEGDSVTIGAHDVASLSYLQIIHSPSEFRDFSWKSIVDQYVFSQGDPTGLFKSEMTALRSSKMELFKDTVLKYTEETGELVTTAVLLEILSSTYGTNSSLFDGMPFRDTDKEIIGSTLSSFKIELNKGNFPAFTYVTERSGGNGDRVWSNPIPILPAMFMTKKYKKNNGHLLSSPIPSMRDSLYNEYANPKRVESGLFYKDYKTLREGLAIRDLAPPEWYDFSDQPADISEGTDDFYLHSGDYRPYPAEWKIAREAATRGVSTRVIRDEAREAREAASSGTYDE